uniref:Carrier domain-containing protein n=1 Tax=Caenorhabditis japonica TaxID=281687 RepID=A0A8R1IN26_CAEJA
MELLHCSSPAPTDHFFLIGGHSLLLIRLRHQIQVRLDHHLTIPELLENLKFVDMLKLLDSKNKNSNKTEVSHKKTTIIFFPALYGGCVAYLKLTALLRGKFEVVLLDEELGESVDEVAKKYAKQIGRKVTSGPDSRLIFIGASSAGTFAHATCLHYSSSHITVILLDTGTYWDLIENLDYQKHEM